MVFAQRFPCPAVQIPRRISFAEEAVIGDAVTLLQGPAVPFVEQGGGDSGPAMLGQNAQRFEVHGAGLAAMPEEAELGEKTSPAAHGGDGPEEIRIGEEESHVL